MRNYCLNIAGYNIRVESAEDGPEIVPAERFLRNICSCADYNILIKVHSGAFVLPEESERVFIAPYIVEIKGIKTKRRDNFWSVYKYQADLFIATNFPYSSPNKKAVLKFSLTTREWDLWIAGAGDACDPFEYPLDGFVLYYLTAINGDIMIHASGVNIDRHGYLFSGISGKGKTTMANLWDKSGARIIHDDRIILRNTSSGYRMFNTPVYNDDKPLESSLDKIFIIDHGTSNKLLPVKGASAVSQVMANCIQHNWDSEIIARLLGSVSIMCSSIPVYNLFFRPDRSVIDHILENE
ncbi:MAG: hypothetical protein MUO72_01805 [Bacteroidales bacterium]|nr:hypothetical protein [Bacteroidales bacterium]